MKVIKHSAILSFIALLLLFSAIPALADEVAILTYTKGRVDLLKPGSKRAEPVEKGGALSVGDIIRTKSDSKAEITFIDGSVIRLAQNTRIEITTYLFDEKGKRKEGILNLFRGKTRAIIPKTSRFFPAALGDGPKFEIHTPNAVAGVRGTDFFTLYWGGVTSVLFLENSGYTYNPENSDQVVIVSAGESTVIISDEPPEPVREIAEGEVDVLITDTSPEATAEEEEGGSDDDSATGGETTTDGGITYTPPEEEGTTENEPPTTTETTIIPEETVVVVFEDTVAPVTSYTTKASIDPDSGNTTLSFSLSSDEPVEYSYNLEGVGGTSTTGDISFLVLADGSYTFDYIATDVGGNTDSDNLSFYLSLYTLTGSASGTGSSFTGSVTGDIAGIFNSDWGGWLMEMSGAYTGPNGSSWEITSGGDGFNSLNAWDGFWLQNASGLYGDGSTLSGTSEFTYLTTTTLGTGTGVVEGTYDAGLGTWEATASDGGASYTETPLAFGAILTAAVDEWGATIGNFGYWDPNAGELSWSGYVSGLLGGTESLWIDSPEFVAIGTYSNPYNETLWRTELVGSTPYGETFYGGVSGISLNDSLEGMAGALYIRPDGAGGYWAGYLSGSLTAVLYSDLGMWSETSGTITATDMTNLSALPTLYGTKGDGSIGGDIFGSLNLESLYFLIDDEWGISWMEGGGTFASAPSINWTAVIGGHSYDDLDNINRYWMGDITGTDWSGDRLAGTIDGTFMGESSMGTFTSDLLGTYEGTSNGTWQGVSFGTFEGTPLAFGGAMSADISHKTHRYTGSYDYNDGSYYEYDYYEDNSWGNGYYSLTDEDITYYADGTTKTCGSGGCTYGVWDPATEDLAVLLAPPAGTVISSYLNDYPYTSVTGSMDGLIGGTDSLWSGPAALTIMGEYSDYYGNSIWVGDDIYSYNHDNDTFTTYDDGAYYGLIGGIKYSDNLEGELLALYIDPAGNAGFLRSDLTGAFYTDTGMWDASGTLTTVEINSTTVLPSDLYGTITVDSTDSDGASVDGVITSGGSMTGLMNDGPSYSISGEDWGIFQIEADGTYTGGATSGALELSTEYTEYVNDASINGFESTGTWTTGDNKFIATGLGYGAGAGSAWISVGNTFGTFNPDTLTWESLMMGIYLDATQFLRMACPSSPCSANPQTLQDLNIPAIEVGRATLSGSGNGFTDLSMTDTIFFAYSSGEAPMIWASGDVNGVYTATPVIDTAIALSGGGLSANFTIKDWNTIDGTWLSAIDGTGGFNGSTTFTGAGAGTGATTDFGTITGTATGLAE